MTLDGAVHAVFGSAVDVLPAQVRFAFRDARILPAAVCDAHGCGAVDIAEIAKIKLQNFGVGVHVKTAARCPVQYRDNDIFLSTQCFSKID